jgi:hypothetical protein
MNGMKLSIGPPHGGIHWSDIEMNIRKGRQLRAEAVGRWVGAGWKALLRLVKPSSNGEAAEDLAARRLRLHEFVSDPSKGFFWPRLSWIAHEGLRLVAADERQQHRADERGTKPRVASGNKEPRVTGHRAIGG